MGMETTTASAMAASRAEATSDASTVDPAPATLPAVAAGSPLALGPFLPGDTDAGDHAGRAVAPSPENTLMALDEILIAGRYRLESRLGSGGIKIGRASCRERVFGYV